ncbi:hypothetical protein ACFQBS_35585 [Planomonospora parontospora]|uniref:hypothetical protein n=1 Tax=Planomonospora parontospora TaxID=58119 RepID=UPI0036100536
MALERLGGDALLVRRLCEAILATTPPVGEDGQADEAAVELLAHASAHAPVLLRDWPCTAGECDHPAGACVTTAACPACSLQAGQWAAAREGAYRAECTIGAPCQVLATLAAHLGVTGSAVPGEAA